MCFWTDLLVGDVIEVGLYGSSASFIGPLHLAIYAVDIKEFPPLFGPKSKPELFFKLFSEKSLFSPGRSFDSKEA